MMRVYRSSFVPSWTIYLGDQVTRELGAFIVESLQVVIVIIDGQAGCRQTTYFPENAESPATRHR
jgi:hypothetical protein